MEEWEGKFSTKNAPQIPSTGPHNTATENEQGDTIHDMDNDRKDQDLTSLTFSSHLHGEPLQSGDAHDAPRYDRSHPPPKRKSLHCV